MDHLQKVSRPVREPLLIPFLCDENLLPSTSVSFEDFKNIPRDRGFSIWALSHKMVDRQSLERNIAFLQSWLFFGLLAQTLGSLSETFRPDDFIKRKYDDDGRQWITTESLPKYLWFWLAVRHHQSRQETEGHAKLVDSRLELANGVLNSFSRYSLIETTPPLEDVQRQL